MWRCVFVLMSSIESVVRYHGDICGTINDQIWVCQAEAVCVVCVCGSVVCQGCGDLTHKTVLYIFK